jgi:uncharacterized PurR-regulated membrane protein YhhQ (DUF165 family)
VKGAGWAAFAAYVATVWAANWLIVHFGAVDVGFGLQAPAGVFAVGLALTLRDLVQTLLGRWHVIAAILIAAALSFVIAPAFAAASAAAFLVSEAADFAVYTPLEHRNWLGAIALSNTVGLAVDSVIFLTLAFGSLEFFWGQCVGKALMTMLAVSVLAVIRGPLLARHAQA